HVVPTYAQPAWVTDKDAIKAAITGNLSHIVPIPEKIAPIQPIIELPQSSVDEGDDDMSERLEQKMTAVLDQLSDVLGERFAQGLREEQNPTPLPKVTPSVAWTAASVDDIYDAIKTRLISEIMEDPKILQLISSQPELHVIVK